MLTIVVLILCATVILRETAENREYCLVPFWSYAMESQDLQYSMYVENLMNVLMFIPLGFTLGCAFKDMGWKRMIIVALCMSAGIEILQYVMKKGFAEVDDVMHNTLGCLIGFMIVAIIKGVWQSCSYLFVPRWKRNKDITT